MGGGYLQRHVDVLRDKSLTAELDVVDSNHVMPQTSPFPLSEEALAGGLHTQLSLLAQASELYTGLDKRK